MYIYTYMCINKYIYIYMYHEIWDYRGLSGICRDYKPFIRFMGCTSPMTYRISSIQVL